jgi:hypothetical protein
MHQTSHMLLEASTKASQQVHCSNKHIELLHQHFKEIEEPWSDVKSFDCTCLTKSLHGHCRRIIAAYRTACLRSCKL